MSSQRPTIRVVAAVIRSGDKYLITQRREKAVLPLLWEFPGGKVEEGESDDEALKREVRYRIGVETEAGELISYRAHPYDHYVVDLYTYECRVVGGEPEARNVQDFRWVRSDEFDNFQFTPADEKSVAKLLGLDE
jgi:8-oxo-dGTP diphosphatase